MRFVVRSIHLLALVVVLVGLWALLAPRDPRSLAAVVEILGDFLPGAVAHPVVVSAAVGLVASGILRWYDERRLFAEKAPRESIGEPPTRRGGDDAEDGAHFAPVSDAAQERRSRDRRRIRLEAFLRGRPDPSAFVRELLEEAARAGASDIHLRPEVDGTRCEFRVRGELSEVATFAASVHADVARRIKVLAGLVPYVAHQPQDGRLTFVLEDRGARREISVRVAVVPSSRGEKITLRLAGDARALPLAELGLSAEDRGRFESILTEAQGLVVLTGPTGCGKTTTLYSALGHLHAAPGGRVLASIEDPVEVDLPFVQQTQVDRARSLGFAEALRAILRQDPDVLMVGEIRDAETARIAVQAGLSGHLILTTLHAESAVGVFPRLIDLGLEPFLVGSSTLACVSQRLLPRLCPSCRHPRSPSREERSALDKLGAGDTSDGKVFAADGCGACGDSGFDGRVGVFEILRLDSDLRRLVAARESVEILRARARDAGHRTLGRAAVDAALRGEVALADALALARAEGAA